MDYKEGEELSDSGGFKYSIRFSQSVTSGVIGFSGEYNFDGPCNPLFLVNMLQIQEAAFKEQGYRVASDIEPKPDKDAVKKLKDENKKKSELT